MVTYKYTAVSHSGEKVSGVIEGFNELDAVDRIKKSCDIVLKLTEVKDKEGFLNVELDANKMNKKAFTVMCSQFAIILRAGIPIARAVQLIADKTTDKKLHKLLKKVGEDVEAGRSLASSFAEHGEKFLPITFIETIRAGEETGNVDRSFETMYQHYDKQTKMAAKVKSALAYPAFVLVLAVVVVIVLMVKVVPVFTQIFDSYGAQLPLMTRMLIGISNFFSKNILWIVIVAVVLAIAYKLYGNTESGRLKLAQLALKIPVFGNINQLNGASQFSNTMTTMLGAGLPMTRAISITAKTLSNYHLSQEIGKLTGKLEEGHSLGSSMRESGCMPDILTDMVAVGEETGEMEETLDTIARYYDTELEMAVDSAMKKLEPTVLIFIAGVGGFIVIAVYLAMFQMYAAM